MSNKSWLTQNEENVSAVQTSFCRPVVLKSSVELAHLVDTLRDSVFNDLTKWLSSLVYFPFRVETYVNTGVLKIGNKPTNVKCGKARLAYSLFNMGEYYYPRYFNNFADYNGYTRVSIYLPYYGYVNINPNDVINKYIQFRLKVDFISGQAIWFIGVTNESRSSASYMTDNEPNMRILEQRSFQLGVPIPLGAVNTTEIWRNLALGAIKVGAVFAGAHMAGAVGAGIASGVTRTVNTERNPKTGRQITMSTETSTSEYNHSNYYKGQAINHSMSVSTETLGNLHTVGKAEHPNTPNLLLSAPQSIKIIIYRPKLIDTTPTYRALYGVPLGTTKRLGVLQGYTKIGDVHIEGQAFATATQTEIAMISEALSEGVIL